MVNRMKQVAISSTTSSQPHTYHPHSAQPPYIQGPAISSHRPQYSIRSASTTRTTSSSNESALNLRQHYKADSGNVKTNSQARTANGALQNPLLDLLSSERENAGQMTRIVRVSPQGTAVTLSHEQLLKLSIGQQKVAAAWSRHNLPPPLLDCMSRAIEGVYKISNRWCRCVKRGTASLSLNLMRCSPIEA